MELDAGLGAAGSVGMILPDAGGSIGGGAGKGFATGGMGGGGTALSGTMTAATVATSAFKQVIMSPLVSVMTRKENGKIIIKVSDNGMGIPNNLIDKVFQPFFTTKPSGKGTGLGLSMSYDFIKAHDGTIKVETKEGEGSVFVVELPFEESEIDQQETIG